MRGKRGDDRHIELESLKFSIPRVLSNAYGGVRIGAVVAPGEVRRLTEYARGPDYGGGRGGFEPDVLFVCDEHIVPLEIGEYRSSKWRVAFIGVEKDGTVRYTAEERPIPAFVWDVYSAARHVLRGVPFEHEYAPQHSVPPVLAERLAVCSTERDRRIMDRVLFSGARPTAAEAGAGLLVEGARNRGGRVTDRTVRHVVLSTARAVSRAAAH